MGRGGGRNCGAAAAKNGWGFAGRGRELWVSMQEVWKERPCGKVLRVRVCMVEVWKCTGNGGCLEGETVVGKKRHGTYLLNLQRIHQLGEGRFCPGEASPLNFDVFVSFQMQNF